MMDPILTFSTIEVVNTEFSHYFYTTQSLETISVFVMIFYCTSIYSIDGLLPGSNLDTWDLSGSSSVSERSLKC